MVTYYTSPVPPILNIFHVHLPVLHLILPPFNNLTCFSPLFTLLCYHLTTAQCLLRIGTSAVTKMMVSLILPLTTLPNLRMVTLMNILQILTNTATC